MIIEYFYLNKDEYIQNKCILSKYYILKVVFYLFFLIFSRKLLAYINPLLNVLLHIHNTFEQVYSKKHSYSEQSFADFEQASRAT